MIRSFADPDTQKLFELELELERVRRWANIERQALRKLTQLDLAQTLGDMRAPPGNRLEALGGNRKGQWSIRVNDQYRICFTWSDEGPAEVEIVDYH